MRTRIFYRTDDARTMTAATTVRAKDYAFVGELDAVSRDDTVRSLMDPLFAAVLLDVERGIQAGDILYAEDLYHVVMPEGFVVVPPGEETKKFYRQVLAEYERLQTAGREGV